MEKPLMLRADTWPEARIRAKEKRKKVKKAEKLRAKRQAEQAGSSNAKPNPFPQQSKLNTSKCIQVLIQSGHSFVIDSEDLPETTRNSPKHR